RSLDSGVSRGSPGRASEPQFLRAEAEARELHGRLLALDDELKVLDAEAKQVEDIKAFSLDRLNKDLVAGAAGAASSSTATGSVGVGTYASVVDFIAMKM